MFDYNIVYGLYLCQKKNKWEVKWYIYRLPLEFQIERSYIRLLIDYI